MELQFYGANCLSITNKQVRLVVDDNLSELGSTAATKAGNVAIFTHEHGLPTVETKLIIDGPGEYEVAGVSIQGIAARAHVDEPDKRSATIYKIIADDVTMVVAGHIYPELSDKDLEALGLVDILVVPVGGNGYTLDATGALAIIKKIEPKLVIPTHYDDKKLKFPVPQASLPDVLKNLAMEPKEIVSKLKVRPVDLTDVTQLIVLEKT